jgi:hypothetical protein
MDYRQMRDMCNGWVETINYNVREASTDIEKEMMTVAGKEIIALVREKYNMDPSNAASMFLTIGMGMVYELDRQHDEKRKQK